MIKLFLSLLLLTVYIYAETVIKPFAKIEIEGNVVEINLKDENLYVATDAGNYLVFNRKELKLKNRVDFERIHDFMGDEISPKVFCIDADNSQENIIALVQAEGGERTLYICNSSNKCEVLLDKKAHLAIREVRFVDNNNLLIATMSDELILFNIPKKKFLYTKKLSLSAFSDFQLNEDKTKVASSCESGVIYVNDVKTGRVIHVLEGGNKDNVYKVDFKNNTILSCGQDRKAVIYRLPNNERIIYNSDFLVYSGALNMDASKSAISFNEQNDIAIFDNLTKKLLYRLVGHNSTINTIVFASDKELISSGDENQILIWRLP